MAPSKHLIVGGLGNLGRILQKQLLQNGVAVKVLDRPSVAQNRPPVDSTIEVHPYTLGVDSSKTLCKLLENVETVYSIATPDIQLGTIQEIETTNVKGIKELLEACQLVGVPKLIHGSCAAVTNSFISTRNGKEEDPLPPLGSYRSHHDIAKRLGEECVLAANSNNLQTCALRFGDIIGGPSSYVFRRVFDCPGKIFTVSETQRRDYLSGTDASRALWKAHKHLDRANGRAIYVTHSNDTVSPTPTDINHHIGKIIDWPVQEVPSWMTRPVQVALELQYTLTAPLLVDPPGCPPHLVLDIPNYEKTFDNRLAKELLDYEPTIRWTDAMEIAVEQYKATLPYATAR